MRSTIKLIFAAAIAVVLSACQKEEASNSSGPSADPTTHTVHLVQAGELTDALIIEAIGTGKDLVITGAMDSIDFATLLKWGTAGLTNSNADLLRTLDLRGVTGLTAVPEWAFISTSDDVSLLSLQRIDLPATVTVVGKGAFQRFASLTKFDAPELQTVGKDAFHDCTALTSVSAPKLQTVEESAFNNCPSLTTFTTSELLSAGKQAFRGCTSLTTFTASKLQTVGEGVFSDCSALTEVTAPELLTVGRMAFYNCPKLIKLIFPKFTAIGEDSFANCPALAELHLTTVGNITLDEKAFQYTNTANCTLYLHQNKKNGGSGTPAVDADGKTWGGLTWKNIVFVNDDGTPIP